MKLHIPERSSPGKDAFPGQPRKIKKWLAELPHANMGEMTRQIYSALRDLNRQSMPGKQRLEIMEMLRQPVRNIFDYLKKYFVNRTLPLPEKSRKIINLNLSLLQEMAYGYKTVIFEAANGVDKKADARSVAIASQRTLRYLSELLLRCSEIYAETPKGVWVDAHRIYTYAETQGLHERPIDDNESPGGKCSIENAYKQLLLFSLARPIALRQSDIERLYGKLPEWAPLSKLGNRPMQAQIDRFFCANIDQDRPPGYLRQENCSDDQRVHILDTSALVDLLRKEISHSENQPDKIVVGDAMPPETLKVLAMSWGACAKRRFSRADKHGHIAAAIGLSHAAEAIRKENAVEPQEEDIRPQHKSNDPGLSLEAIPELQRDDGYLTHTELGNTEENAWDMVASGKSLTDAYDRERKLLQAEALKLKKEDPDLHWQVVNVSAGGYCLRWNSDSTSRAQIGEIIALREREANGNYQWRVGVIRWMQFTREHGLEIGVQVLSPKVIAATVRRSKRPNEKPFEALMLPGIRPIKQPPSVLAPAHAFKPGDRLTVNVFEQDMEIKLGDPREHTGSFTQFSFLNMDEAKRAQKQTGSKQTDSATQQDDFDEIWSSL